ncbi:ATP-binding cassette domain-containing protein, partial [Sodalis-like symbiont of Bactericera trigonica]
MIGRGRQRPLRVPAASVAPQKTRKAPRKCIITHFVRQNAVINLFYSADRPTVQCILPTANAVCNAGWPDSCYIFNIHLELPHGQCTCLLGCNGVGKTTLINCIMGHVPVSSVTWQLRGEDAQDLLAHPAEARASLGIGYVPQGRQIFSQLSVEENLHVALLARRNHTR